MKSLIYASFLFIVGYSLVYFAAKPTLRRYIGPGFVVCFLLTTAAGFIAPNALFFFASIILIFVFTVRDRMDAICRYALMMALIPIFEWNPTLGSIYLFSIDPLKILGVSLFIALIFKAKNERKPLTWRLSSEDAIVFVFFLILWIAAGRFPSATIFLRSGVEYLTSLILPFWIIRRSIRNVDEFSILVAIFGITTVLLGVYAIFETRNSWSLFDYVGRHLSTTTIIAKNAAQRGGLLRASVTMATALNFACYMSLGIIALACTRRFYRSSAIFAVLVGIAVLGFLAPQSRGNLICLSAGLLMLTIAWRKWGYAAAAVGASAIGGLALLVVARNSARVAGFLNLNSAVSGRPAGQFYDYRQLLLQRGLEEGMKHPILGASMKDVLNRLVDITQGEHIVDMVNTYLFIFLVSGIVGLIATLSLITYTLSKLLIGFPGKLDPNLNLARAFALAGFVVIVIEFVFMSFIDRMPYMLAFVLVGVRLVAFAKKGAWQRFRAQKNKAAPEVVDSRGMQPAT